MGDERGRVINRRRFHGGHALIGDELVRADVVVEGESIVEIVTAVPADPTTEVASSDIDGVDCRDRVIAAGFIDLQCNGAGGVDITSEPPRIIEVAAQLARFGVTSFLPTVVTAPASTRAAAKSADAIPVWPAETTTPAATNRSTTSMACASSGASVTRATTPDDAQVSISSSSDAGAAACRPT